MRVRNHPHFVAFQNIFTPSIRALELKNQHTQFARMVNEEKYVALPHENFRSEKLAVRRFHPGKH
jgi:hypothetical protein